jgi:hypothetical protein
MQTAFAVCPTFSREEGNMSGFLALVSFLGFFVLLFGFILLLRYMSYRETIALAEKGLLRTEPAHSNGKGALRWGIAIASLGLALCIGLYPLGSVAGGGLYPLNFGPWMLAGLIPLFFGLGLVLIHVLTYQDQPKPALEKTETHPA